MRRFRIVRALAQRLWVIPSLGVVSGVLLSLLTVSIGREYENGRVAKHRRQTGRTCSRS